MLNVYCDAAYCPNLKVGAIAWVYIDPSDSNNLVVHTQMAERDGKYIQDANQCEELATKLASDLLKHKYKDYTFNICTDSQYTVNKFNALESKPLHYIVSKVSREKVDAAHRAANVTLTDFRNLHYAVCSNCSEAQSHLNKCKSCGSTELNLKYYTDTKAQLLDADFKLSVRSKLYDTTPSKLDFTVAILEGSRVWPSVCTRQLPCSSNDSKDVIALSAASMVYSAISGKPASDLARLILELESDEPEIGSDDLYCDYVPN